MTKSQTAHQVIDVTNKATELNNQWLTEKQAAEFLNVSPSFLAKNRCYAKGECIIPFAKLSAKCIRYNYYQLQSWLDAQIQAFKSEELA
jgi:hypothetical protein